jgi:hypothetical protein
MTACPIPLAGTGYIFYALSNENNDNLIVKKPTIPKLKTNKILYAKVAKNDFLIVALNTNIAKPICVIKKSRKFWLETLSSCLAISLASVVGTTLLVKK